MPLITPANVLAVVPLFVTRLTLLPVLNGSELVIVPPVPVSVPTLLIAPTAWSWPKRSRVLFSFTVNPATEGAVAVGATNSVLADPLFKTILPPLMMVVPVR